MIAQTTALPATVPFDETIGVTPWSVPRPMILAAHKASAAGFAEADAYEETLPELCAWLATAARDRDWRDVFPVLAAYPEELFDYAAEDRYFENLENG